MDELIPEVPGTKSGWNIFEDLVEYLKTINSDLADVVTLGFQGFDKKGVVKQLSVKSSQAYDLYAKAEKLTREFLFK